MKILWINIGRHYAAYLRVLYDSKEVKFDLYPRHSYTEQLERGFARLAIDG